MASPPGPPARSAGPDRPRGGRPLPQVVAVLVVASLVATVLVVAFQPTASASSGPRTFASAEDMVAFLDRNEVWGATLGYYGHGYGLRGVAFAASDAVVADAAGAAGDAAAGGAAADHSTTNVQVEGVDEADIVKNDGQYIYVVSQGRVLVVRAFPPSEAGVVAEVPLPDGSARALYLAGDRLVVLGRPDRTPPAPTAPPAEWIGEEISTDPTRDTWSPADRFSATYVRVYDVSDPSDPALKRDVTVHGRLQDSRLIGDDLYAVLEAPLVLDEDGDPVLPLLHPDQEGFPEVQYFEGYARGYGYTNILSVDVRDDDEEARNEAFLLGRTTELYASASHLYLAGRQHLPPAERTDLLLDRVVLPVVPGDLAARLQDVRLSDLDDADKQREYADVIADWSRTADDDRVRQLHEDLRRRGRAVRADLGLEWERTGVHRFSLDAGEVSHVASGEVPGHVLNQFSMDEHDGHFRIATTVGHVRRTLAGGEVSSTNNVYVLDAEMDVVGRLEGVAPNERIYSARFMGDRGYLVTFKKVDPFFVLDLSDPSDPRVLGELKLPGYSDYLHPLGDDHVIGIGKDTVEAASGDFAWYQGVKVAVFDVTDVTDPRVLDDLVIGDRGTDSEVLRDHKAFLLDADRGFMVLPIVLAEIDESDYPDGEVPPNAHGSFVWQGAYVLDVSINEGLSVRGRVAHDADPDAVHGEWWYRGGDQVRRSVTMDDVLYTVSSSTIKASALDDLSEIAQVTLGDRT